MRPSNNSKFGFEGIKELTELFVSKGWDQFAEYEAFFNNYCRMLEHFNEEQSTLVMNLTRDFFWLRSSDYYTHLKSTLLLLGQFKHLDLSTIHIVPLVSKKDREKKKVKSSYHVAYLCQNSELKYIDILKNTKFRIHNNYDHLPKNETLKKNGNPVILIDDFIGTGDTAFEALDEILEHRDYDEDTLFIASIVCQNTGRQELEDLGFNVLSPNVRHKGISDSYEGDEEYEMKRLMVEIETILSEDKRFESAYEFGYKKSEALVAMIRTPNNTFPIYWFNAKIGGTKNWMAPFARD